MSACSIEGCGGKVAGRGFCMMHYTRFRRTGDPLKTRRIAPNKNPPKTCTYDGCEKPHQSKGFCSAHYTRLSRHGDPSKTSGTPAGEPMDWISRHSEYKEEGCLAWPYARGGRGDAVVSHNGKMRSASRVMCELVHGMPENERLECAHNCGNGHLGCMNPRHLRWDTRSGNHADKLKHGTHNRGERSPMAKLSEIQVRHIRKSDLSNKRLSEMLGVSRAAVYAARCGINWAHLD